jgi:hypothetical protein
MRSVGRSTWVIAEGYIPDGSTGPEPEMLSHETACMLNTGDEDAHVRITVFFKDRGRPDRTRWSSLPAGRCTNGSTS